MNAIRLTIILSLLVLMGCIKESETANRFDSYYLKPVVFEVHDVKIIDEDVTAAIRSQDTRLEGKSIYLDCIFDVFSGETKISESAQFIYLNDNIGKIDVSLYISSKEEEKINPSKEISVKVRIVGWGEMFPGIVEQH